MSAARGVLAVARLEFQQALWSRLSVVLGALFLLIVAGGAYLGSQALGSQVPAGVLSGPAGQATLFAVIAVLVAIFGPIVPIVSSVLSIVEERATRTIDLLLARPVSRRGLVLGKLLGRAAHGTLVAVAGILLGLLLAAREVNPSVPDALVLAGLAALLMAAWVGLAVLLSAHVRTPTSALVGAFVLWFVFVFWGLVGALLDHLGVGALAPLLNPNTLFLGSVRAVLPPPGPAATFLDSLVEGLDVNIALPALVVFLVATWVAAVLAFDRQDEAGGP